MQEVQQSMVAIKKDPNEEVKSDSPKEEEKQEMVPFLELFRFATSIDYLFMTLGTIAALGMGGALPSFAILWGSITDKFAIGGQALEDASRTVMLEFIYIGIATFIAGWAMFAFWMIAGERQAITCRKEYLKSLLKQQIGWFDKINQAQLASNFAADCFAYQGALGEKISTIFMTLGMFIVGFVIAFVKGWLMTLVVLCSIPLIMIGGVMFAKATEGKDKVLKDNYAKAGGIAEQAISAIKTVKLLNGEEFESNQYKRALKDVASKAARFAIFAGVSMGFLFFAMLASYSLGFWFGSNCVEGASNCDPSLNNGSTYTAGDVIVIFFSILMAGFNLGQLTPALKKIAEGRSAATRIFKIIDRKSQIFSKEGAITPTVFKGVFKFNNVTFAYPKNPSKVILNNLNLTIDCNTAAFVGQSGCGKSTIFQLLMRFYDPNAGSITLDGNDLRDVDLYWLRQQLGYVGQEPVLFATTIRENLLFGKEDATEEEIIVALKKAEAYDFVMNQFTDKLDTNVGTSGGQLSGGQKQRIAIARALLKNPKVLLLDEATSALDRRNERLIQATLNKITSEQITMTIAHRIKTIMSSDKIFVITHGSVEEEGRFSDLKRFIGIKAEEDHQEDANNAQEVGEVELKGEVQKQGAQLIIDEQRRKEQKKKKEEQEQKMLTDKYEEQIFSRVFSYGSDQKCWFAAGVVSAIANGLIFPTFSIFLSKMLSILIKFLNDKATARTEANLYALIFLILAIISFFTNLFQLAIFTKIGQKITQNIRESVFAKILRMPVAWFDKPHNNSGALTVRLAEDCQSVNGLTTTYAAILIQNISTLLAGIIIAFVYEWRTSLVALALLPFMIVCGVIQMKFMTGFSDKTGQAYEESSFLIVEAMVNIRTVTSFGYEDMIERKYSSYLKGPMVVGIQKGNVSGVLFGLSQFVMFIVFGLIFYFGSVFINNFSVSVADVFTAIYSLVFAGMTIGNNSHFIPDIGKAKNAAANLFFILDSEDEDQMQIREQSKMLKTSIKGDICIQNISFKYETRSNHVFKNINLIIKQGQKIAFVGSSGCGKSTILQLLQRFYHPEEGRITIDGVNIADYDIHHLRACFGVVSQEPTLFNNTIGYNIKYNLASATQQQIKSAAIQSSFDPELEKIVITPVEKTSKKREEADVFDQSSETLNGHDPEGTGFDKNVGIKGSHISGGQKQRVAIARAIIRKPTILLLDEATSALDGQNQRKVQESLDRIMKSKTTITVAHRIDTIKNSDQIVVFDQGQIVEKGRYEQLIAAKGKFYNLERGTQFL